MSVTMGVDPSKQFRSLENVESKILLRDLILEESVDKYRNHVERWRYGQLEARKVVAAYIMSIRRSIYSVAFFTAYGQRVKALVGTDLLEFFIGLLRCTSHNIFNQRHTFKADNNLFTVFRR